MCKARPMNQKESTLTERQIQVLGYLKTKLMNKEIAYEIGIKEKTVKFHVTAIFKKLGFKSRSQLREFYFPLEHLAPKLEALVDKLVVHGSVHVIQTSDALPEGSNVN